MGTGNQITRAGSSVNHLSEAYLVDVVYYLGISRPSKLLSTHVGNITVAGRFNTRI